MNSNGLKNASECQARTSPVVLSALCITIVSVVFEETFSECCHFFLSKQLVKTERKRIKIERFDSANLEYRLHPPVK